MSPTITADWIKQLDHSDFCLQSWRNSPDAVADWVRDLDHADAGLRATAARMLGSMGRAARPAVERLTNRLRDADPSVRSAAAHALREINEEPTPPNPGLRGRYGWALLASGLLLLILALLAGLVLS